MPDNDEQPEGSFDELENAKGINFRDYPSSGLVVVAAALSSGLGWMLYKWVGRKRSARSDTSEAAQKSADPASKPDLPENDQDRLPLR